MNTKKINLAILSCLLLMNNFQVSGSEVIEDQKIKANEGRTRGEECVFLVAATGAFALLSLIGFPNRNYLVSYNLLDRQWKQYTDTFSKEIKPCLTSDGSVDCLNVGEKTWLIGQGVTTLQNDLKKEAEACMKKGAMNCQSDVFWNMTRSTILVCDDIQQKECEKKRKLAEKLCVKHAASKFQESASKHGYQYKG